MKFQMRYFTLGGIAGVVTKPLLGLISTALSYVPGVDVSLQSVSVTTTGLGGVINPGLNTYANKLLGLVNVPFTMPEWIMLFIGSGLFVLLGAYLVEWLKMPKSIGLKETKLSRLTTIFVAASIVSSMILAMAVAIPAIPAMITLIINAFILAWILVMVDDMLGTKLVP